MKYIGKEAQCIITLDSRTDNKHIQLLIHATACMLMGVDVNDQWDDFADVLEEATKKLMSLARDRASLSL